MSVTHISTEDLDLLRDQLAHQTDPEKRLWLLDEVIPYYLFTDAQEAHNLLIEQKELLTRNSHPDIELHFHHNFALLENQLYHFEEAKSHFERAIPLVKDRGNVGQQVDIYIDYAATTINLNRLEETIDILDKAGRLLDSFPDDRHAYRLICREGILFLHISSYSKAKKLLLQAEKSLQKISSKTLKDYYFLTLIYSGLGTIYHQNGEIQKGIDANQRVLEICNQTGIRSRLSWHYLNIGRSFIGLGEIKQAAQYLDKAIHVKDDLNPASQAAAYANLGYCAYLSGQANKASKLYTKATKLYKQSRRASTNNLSVIEHWRGLLQLAEEKPEKAKHHFNKAIKLAEEKSNWQQLSVVFRSLAELHAEAGAFQEAYHYLQLHNQNQELYQNALNQRALMEMEVKYEAETKKKEAEFLRLQASSLQLKALRAQMNPHFIYNALNAIQHYITSMHTGKAAKYLAQFALLMRQSLHYSDEEVISLENEIDFLRNYLELNQQLRFENSMTYTIYVDPEIEEDIMGVPTMIIQPYVENAIEHGIRSKPDGNVKVSFYLQDEDAIRCIIEDNGIGRALAGKQRAKSLRNPLHRSRGTSITQRRLELLHRLRGRTGNFVEIKDLYHNDQSALGTRVEILIPIMETKNG